MKIPTYTSKISVFLLLVLFTISSFGQEFYFTDLGEATLNKKDAKTIVTLSKSGNKVLSNAFLMIDEENAIKIGHKKAKLIDENTLKITVKREGKVAYKMKRVFKKIDNKTYLVKDYDNYGNIAFIGKASSYFPLIKNGWGATFYDNGNIASTAIYNNNKVLINENWTSEGNKTFSNAYHLTDKAPAMEGSSENYIYALAKHIENNIKKNYHSLFFDDNLNLNGKRNLNINFIVNTEGKVEVTNIEGYFKDELKSDIENVIAQTSGDWKPGYINNLAVNTKLTLPVHIKPYTEFPRGNSDHINHWFFYNDMPVRLYRW